MTEDSQPTYADYLAALPESKRAGWGVQLDEGRLLAAVDRSTAGRWLARRQHWERHGRVAGARPGVWGDLVHIYAAAPTREFAEELRDTLAALKVARCRQGTEAHR